MENRMSVDTPKNNAVWIVRGIPALALVLVTLAQFVFKSAPIHDFCLGSAIGLLVVLCAYSSGIKRVELNDAPQPSDVSGYPLT